MWVLADTSSTMDIFTLFEHKDDVLALDMGAETLCTPTYITIGGTVGKVPHTSLAFHELSHLVEGSDSMVTLPDFGLPDGGVRAQSQKYLSKEADTFAIQAVLENHYSNLPWKDRHWDSYSSMAIFCWSITHFGNMTETVKKTEKLIEQRVAHWSLESILLELERKVELLRTC